MRRRATGWLIVAAGLAAGFVPPAAHAAPPTARTVEYHGYAEAIELRHGAYRAVVAPAHGGRVLEFSRDGHNALYFDAAGERPAGHARPRQTAGRFDYGPELVVTPHPTLWSSDWTGQITGPGAARLTSPRDEAAGVRLVRDFALDGDAAAGHVRLVCTQSIENISTGTLEVCHWGRSFSPGGGICVIPLGDRPSRFPARYAMYEDSAIINVRNHDERIRVRDGFLEILGPPRRPKLGFDTYAGWLAYLMPGGQAFVKRFATDPDRVYNEAAGLTLSVWYPEGPQIELEPIGPRERLAPGERAAFTEEWWLVEYPFPAEGEQVDLPRLARVVAEETVPPGR